MRILSLIILSVAFLSTSALADDKLPATTNSTAMSGDWRMSMTGNILGKRYTAWISPSDLAKNPLWSPADENPPVSVREAVRLATKSLAETLGDLKSWSRGDIKLTELRDGHWIYQVDFTGPAFQPPDIQMKVNFVSAMQVAVLMNGRTICPKLEHEK